MTCTDGKHGNRLSTTTAYIRRIFAVGDVAPEKNKRPLPDNRNSNKTRLSKHPPPSTQQMLGGAYDAARPPNHPPLTLERARRGVLDAEDTPFFTTRTWPRSTATDAPPFPLQGTS